MHLVKVFGECPISCDVSSLNAQHILIPISQMSNSRGNGYNISHCLSLSGICTNAVGIIKVKQLFPVQRQINCFDCKCFGQAEADSNRESLCWVCTPLTGRPKAPKTKGKLAWMEYIFSSRSWSLFSLIATQQQAVWPTQGDTAILWKWPNVMHIFQEYTATLNIVRSTWTKQVIFSYEAELVKLLNYC